MSRTPGNSDDDLAVPLALESSGPTLPLADDLTRAPGASDTAAVLAEAGQPSPAFDSELFAREAEAAGDAGDGRRADALVCARALLAERQEAHSAAMALWRGAFDHDPTLLVAFWGLRRSLVRQGEWEDLLGVLTRRIAAVFSQQGGEARADLWLEHGRILEDRLGRDEDAARSYRAGLIELPAHPGLLTALLLLGLRREDPNTTAEALAGLLRRPLPPAIRVSTAVSLARLERTAKAPNGAVAAAAAGAGDARPLDPLTATRVLDTLRSALRTVDQDSAGPLLEELSVLARATTDPGMRVEILAELVSRLPVADPPSHDPSRDPSRLVSRFAAGMAVPLLRERARVLRDNLDDPAGAMQALRIALARSPGHPLVIAELADLVETTAGQNRAEAVSGLRDLLALVGPQKAQEPYDHPPAELHLFFRYLVALAADDRASEGLTLLARHPRLSRDNPGFFALEMFLRVQIGDMDGLASIFEHIGERLARGIGTNSSDAETAAHALVVAGVLRERSEGAGGAGAGDDLQAASTRLYRRAADVAPDYPPAQEAVERRLWTGRHWRELSDFWQRGILRLGSAAESKVEVGPSRRGQSEGDRAEVTRLFESLVAVERDFMDDPVSARRHQDGLLALGGAPARAWVRRYDLELAAAARGAPSTPETQVGLLRELANRAEVPALESAFRVEAARVAAAAGDAATAEELFKQARSADVSGASSCGLERLAGSAGAAADGPASVAARQAEVVRAEIAQLAEGAGQEERSRALRFRVAWHLRGGKRAGEALEALQPLRAAGDPLALAWSWDIARRSDDPRLQVDLLLALAKEQAAPGLGLPTDLGEALERAGDLSAAAHAFRQAQRDDPSVDAALGLLRVGSALGDGEVVLEATRALAAIADAATGPALSQEAALLALFRGAPAADAAIAPVPAAEDSGHDARSAVLRWAQGSRGGDALGAAAGLLALARALPEGGTVESTMDRNGLFARAATRARLGGVALSGAVHDQVGNLAMGAWSIGVGLADLPVAGRPARIAARIARAERCGGPLAYVLDIERALDAEARGDSAGALDGFARALARDAVGIEALDGIKRVALATGDRLGAARAGLRLGAVLRTPGRAAAELAMAGQILRDLGMADEAAIAYWNALARDPESQWLFECLLEVLGTLDDTAGLDRLYGLRLVARIDDRARASLLLDRAVHRLARMGDRTRAIEDFKRILKIDPDHQVALRHLATLAMQMEHFPQAVRFLERLVPLLDEQEVAKLRLELAEAHEAARDPARAVEALRRAVAARPRSAKPWQRLTDLLLRIGDWSGALATLRSWDTVLEDPILKAEIWLRIGSLLRDHARDGTAAADAFARASALDPLGAGIPELVALQERSGATSSRRDALRRAITDMRHMLEADPLDVARLRRLKELYELSIQGGHRMPASSDVTLAAAGALAAGQILALVGEDVESGPRRRAPLHGTFSPAFWGLLRLPALAGFAAEIWPILASAATDVFPPTSNRQVPRERVAHGSEPRLAWVEAAAVAVGLPTIEIGFLKGTGGTGDAIDASVMPLEGSQPVMLLGRGVLAGDAAARFRVGRALALLRDRTVIFDRTTDADLESLYAAAAALVAAPAPVIEDGDAHLEDWVKALSKAMSRRDRRALELEASRFGFESIDAVWFRQSAVATADRLGLILAGDVSVSVRVAGELGADSESSFPAATIRANRRALDLIRFALSKDYLRLICDLGIEEG